MLRIESRVRARTLQALYAMELSGADSAEAAMGVLRLTGQRALMLDRVEPWLEEITAQLATLDALAGRAADNWRLERIAVVERNILRLAIHELHTGRVPARVAIDEALWLAHRFAGSRAPAFINGVLDRVARDLGRL